MSDTNWYAVICALLVGILFSHFFWVQTETTTKEVQVLVPGPERIVNVSVPSDPLAQAKADFWTEFSEDSDYWTCDGEEFDLSEIHISQIKPGYTIENERDEQTINFDARMRFDEDDEKSCYDTLEVEVFYEDNEKPKVTIN